MDEARPVRRVVTGEDEQGRSCVLFDSAAPSVHAVGHGRFMTNIWRFEECPASIAGHRDDGNLPHHFEPPANGGFLRLIQSAAKPSDYDPAKDPTAVPFHPPLREPGGTWSRGGQNRYTARMHRTETVDYGLLLEGERVLILDDGEYVLAPGDVVVQVGNWHAYRFQCVPALMAFVMMGAKFGDDEPGPGHAPG